MTDMEHRDGIKNSRSAKKAERGVATMKIIEDQTFDMERALYASQGISLKNCSFDGPADGESAFKEGKNIEVQHCFFNLRYPFWHDHGLVIENSDMTELCRAACGIPIM